ncbi:UNVERIFIED_CONTAM: hypothetical protein FKN15_075975 [Acipenser sinensis]
MNTRCPPKRVPSAARFFTLCRLTVQPPQSYSVGGQRSSGQLTGKPAGARPDYRGRWCAGARGSLDSVSFAVSPPPPLLPPPRCEKFLAIHLELSKLVKKQTGDNETPKRKPKPTQNLGESLAPFPKPLKKNPSTLLDQGKYTYPSNDGFKT